MTKKRIQAPHKMKCEYCDVGFAKLVKSDELINGKKHCVYYCEHCKNYKFYEQVEHRPKRFTATTSRGLYCWDNVTGKRYDAVDDFFEMMDLLNDFNDELNKLSDENEQLKQINRNLQDFRNFITEQNVLNEKQRKELQLQMLRLYNYFENWFEDTMSPTAFSEMWDSVKEDKKWEKR